MAQGTPRPGKVDKPMKVFGRLMKYIFKYYKFHYVIILIMIIIGVLANVQGTMFIQSLIDDYIMPMIGAGKPDFGPLAIAITRVAVFYAIGAFATYIFNLLSVYVTQGTLRRLRNDMFEHMEKLPLRYFDSHSHGDIMSMYTNDIDTLRQMISQSIPQIFNSAIMIVSVLVSMIILSGILTLVTLAMIVIIVLASKKVAGLSAKYFVAQQRNVGIVNGFVEEAMEGQKVIKVFCHEEAAKEDFKKRNEDLFDAAYHANFYGTVIFPMNAQLAYVSYVVCAIIGGALAIFHITPLTIGALASFLTFNRSFTQPITSVSQQLNYIVMAMAGADRVFKLLDEEVEPDEGKVTVVNVKETENGFEETEERTDNWAWKKVGEDGAVTYNKLKGDIVFKDVDFGYVPEKTVLYDIDLYAKPGQKIAFVGSTGAGKTTITNLINRFYDIKEGQIIYDGIDIMDIKKSDLRRTLGIVLQDTNLFSGTVKDNIRFGNLDATDEQIIEAAKLANADSFIRKLPDGYDTVLEGNGSNLSQGQRQLLSIARAAVADPPVLILDEATSSIDTRTERIVQEGTDKLMKGRTSFVIAHRLSTIHNADCIMVLEKGHIIERGTHDQLIEAKGRYYQLYTGNQIGG